MLSEDQVFMQEIGIQRACLTKTLVGLCSLLHEIAKLPRNLIHRIAQSDTPDRPSRSYRVRDKSD